LNLTTTFDLYRAKALAAEEAVKTATDVATKIAWTEIAIEWNALAAKTAVGLPDLKNRLKFRREDLVAQVVNARSPPMPTVRN
jgi:hypothetical protein